MYSQQQQPISKKVSYALYCKVCADSKKPMNIVTSHNVRNLKNGAITCPTLLEQSCKQCGQKGHTVSRCKQQAKKDEEPVSKKTKREEPAKKHNSKTSSCSFDALMTDSDDEREEAVKSVAKEVPVCVPAKPSLTGYANALLRRQPEENITVARSVPKQVKPAKDPNRPFSWCDCSSSSEGSDEEEE